jgi:hypothetical protein
MQQHLLLCVTAQAFRVPLLDPYFSAGSFDYKYGVNFAEAGATAASNSTNSFNPFSVTPYQTNQFIRLKNSGALSQGWDSGRLIEDTGLR